MNSIICFLTFQFLFLLHEVNKGRPLDFYGLALSVVQRQHKVEKVAFSQVAWWLFFKMCSPEPHGPPLVQRCGLHPIPNGSVLDGGDWFFLHGWGVGCSDRRHGWGRRNEHVQLHKTESQNLLKITYLRDKIK